MYQISVSTHIEAAHYTRLGEDQDDRRARLHGHSYICRVWLQSDTLDERGVICDLDALKEDIKQVCSTLDYSVLNEVDGLLAPSMESMCQFIWDKLSPSYAALSMVELERPTLGYKASYSNTN